MWCREIPLTIACSQTGFYSEREVYWSTSLSVPEIAGIKLPHLECMDVQYQQSFCCLKSFFLYGLVNTDLVTHTHPPVFCPWHKTISTESYRPRPVPNLSRRQTCAPAKAIKTPARPSMVCLCREGYQYKQRKKKKFIKKTQWEYRG